MTQIPTDIDEIFQELKKEITWLHGHWIIYQQLFAHSEKRIALLNECASTFFYFIQELLLGEIKVVLCKLTDPANSGRCDNLSLEQLQKRIEQHGDRKLTDNSKKLLDDLQNKCKDFRLHRNKRLAHIDLSIAMKGSLNPLPIISRQMIEEALKSTRDYMNSIEVHYLQKETGYEHFIMQADGEALISMLKYGLRYEEILKERKVSMADWHEGRWKDA